MNEPKKRKLSDVMLKREFKLAVTTFLLTLAFVQYAQNPDLIRVLCLCGMAFSTLGDLFLMNYLDVPSYWFRGKHFYAGAASFIVAHIFYRQMFRSITPSANVLGIGDGVTVVIMLILFVIAYNTKFKKKSNLFFAASAFYAGMILSNLAAAINCALALGGTYYFAMLGVVCFIISDLFLFIREAKVDTPLIRKLVWVFYPLAQILIIMNV